VSAARVGASLRLEVRDNGRGLPEGAPVQRGDKGGGVGLANTRARLQQLYGGAHRLDLSNSPAGGAVVTIEFPLQEGAPGGDGPAGRAAETNAPTGKTRPAETRPVSSRA
jgi:sensor histidine kinase YesM